ncbi:hypothetical protein CKO44_24570 [Rubrivivax gelatinosus]|uniref:DUF2889 family protein n=1 Tax=Rubrivivax gelatinosus TaxID=28068 RepID=A0ABS1DTJ5_RUBGE|nr:DUF2889 domain-containing protein [Rubrivivax gelatinosus]MBK1616620.1 hypothetical protein [Rubrivivax gelatinosus]MBK1713036.1 hypothetical protein [Rubrivivax gelatinosus]
MTLPPAAARRQLKHRRQFDVQVFVRDDGLWEVDATLVDTKTRDAQLAGERRAAGMPIHDMLIRLVVDTSLNVVDAGARTRWMPYAGHCDDHGQAYRSLIGLNLARGFRKGLQERVGGVLGCTHITELAQVLPTAVIQAFAGEVIDTRGDGGVKPFQLDRCHALRSDGEVVRLHYPRWHRPAGAFHDTPRSPE